MVSARVILRQILGSFVAVAIAWLVTVVLLALVSVVYFALHSYQLPVSEIWGPPLYFGVWILLFALPIWLVVLMPLYLFVPRSSYLWRWPVCTVCGAVAGVIAVAVVFPLPTPNIASQIWLPYTLGAFVGAATCFAGAVTRDRFKPPTQAK